MKKVEACLGELNRGRNQLQRPAIAFDAVAVAAGPLGEQLALAGQTPDAASWLVPKCGLPPGTRL